MPLLGMRKWFFYWRWRVDSAPPGIGGGQHPAREERRDDALLRDKWDGMLLFESKRGRRLSHGRKDDIAPPRDSRGMACSLVRKEVERGCSLPLLLPPPSFFFSPLFFWRGPQVSPVHTKKLPQNTSLYLSLSINAHGFSNNVLDVLFT